MKRFFWVAILSLVGAVFSFNLANAYTYNAKDCEEMGTKLKGRLGANGCEFSVINDGFLGVGGMSDVFIYNTDNISKYKKIGVREGEIKCPIGFKKDSKDPKWCERDDSVDKNIGHTKNSVGRKAMSPEYCESVGGKILPGEKEYCAFQIDGKNDGFPVFTHDFFNRKRLYISTYEGDLPPAYFPLNEKCETNYKKNDKGVCVSQEDADGDGRADGEVFLEENTSPDQNSCDINWIGFVVCPGARIGTAVVINIYHWIAQNLLQVESKKLFSESPETFKYWNEFRKIANVIFAVVIAVVVFSQVTNVGISNYGIKRMLPRIIIFAILTNISYWLVAALVDLSNIVGQALYMWLGASGNWTAADPNSKDGGLGSLVDGILSGTLEAGAGIAALGVMAATIGGGSILAVLLIAALALLTMFIILTARQAIVIMLVVVSPVAVVSSVLPNTDGFYKKWKSLLKSMLMIYPICSMMMGGMILASNVLYAASDNYLFKVVFGLLPMFGLFATAAVIKSVASMLDGITGTKTFSGALGKLDGAREKARNNRFTRAENRHWKDKLSDSEKKLRARKPNSKRLAILDGARRFKSRVDSRATSLKNENARLQQDYQLGALEQLSNAGKLDPNLEATRATLAAQKEKDHEARTSIESNHLARSIISKAAVSGKSDPYATEFRDEINKLQGDDVNGENLELFMKAIDGTSQLSAAQKVELSRLLLSKYSSTDMVKYQDSIRRIQPIGKKYEDSHPEFHAEVKKGFETAASGTGSFVLTGREKGKVYSSFKPEKFKHLNNQSIKEIQNYYAATGDPNLKLAAQAALSPNSGLGGKLNAEQLAAVQALAR